MAVGSGNTVCPQYNYGQGSGAWNPSSSRLIYQKMELARFDASFALMFCMDILFGKERSGDRVYFWSTEVKYYTDQYGIQHGYLEFGREKLKTKNSKGDGWLYNNNTLNASKSSVPQVFGPPAVKSGNSWCYALPCTTAEGDPLPSGIPQFTIVTDGALTGGDTQYNRMLDAGHIAFVARDHYGTTVCVPYAAGWEPVKKRRGRPECGNSKLSPTGSFYQ